MSVFSLQGKDIWLGSKHLVDMNVYSRTAMGTLLDTGGVDLYFVLDVSGSIPRREKEKGLSVIQGLARKVVTSYSMCGLR